jgi:hypothetical protein
MLQIDQFRLSNDKLIIKESLKYDVLLSKKEQNIC